MRTRLLSKVKQCSLASAKCFTYILCSFATLSSFNFVANLFETKSKKHYFFGSHLAYVTNNV